MRVGSQRIFDFVRHEKEEDGFQLVPIYDYKTWKVRRLRLLYPYENHAHRKPGLLINLSSRPSCSISISRALRRFLVEFKSAVISEFRAVRFGRVFPF